ncbi:MAG: FadR/GntR family transcriptional regulator [Bacillota bacterium]|jgi:GntR family transcriptional repressor for pyruvate dehydrogenase complex
MKPIKKTSVIDVVVTNLKELITSGEIPVDGKLPTEKEISSQLQVGRSSVREAIRMLQAMGFVKIIPGRGAFVAKIKEEDPSTIVNWFIENELQISDFIEVRTAIETLAIRLAILRASEKEIQQLEKIHEQFKMALKNKEIEKLVYYSELFHNSIARATHNHLLITITQKISDAFRMYRGKSFSIKGNAAKSLIPHQQIIQAFRTKDINKGIKAITDHINISLDELVEKADSPSSMQ